LNKGRSASRNLGIQKQQEILLLFWMPMIMPNRFANDIKIFDEGKNCDGVYNAVGFHFIEQLLSNKKQLQLNTMTSGIVHFDALLNGFFHIDGFNAKKKPFSLN
jgi:hypothetical protein